MSDVDFLVRMARAIAARSREWSTMRLTSKMLTNLGRLMKAGLLSGAVGVGGSRLCSHAKW